jgi:hypothetical protein
VSDDDFAQLWATVFQARRLVNDARLGVRLANDDLLRMIEGLLSVAEQLRSRYDVQYSQLWQARDLLRELTGAEPLGTPDHGEEWHAVSHDLLLRAATFLLSTDQPHHDQGV